MWKNKCGCDAGDMPFICNKYPKFSPHSRVCIMNIAGLRRLTTGKNICEYTYVFLCTEQKWENNCLCPVKCFPHAVFMLQALIIYTSTLCLGSGITKNTPWISYSLLSPLGCLSFHIASFNNRNVSHSLKVSSYTLTLATSWSHTHPLIINSSQKPFG